MPVRAVLRQSGDLLALRQGEGRVMPTWIIFAAGSAVILLLSARPLHRWLAGRRKDREWHAYIAAKPRGAELLEWLREQRVYHRIGCVRPIPRAVPDAELEQWEREEIDRMETFYADDGVNPYEQRRTTGDLS
jgi:hypothetical protein